MKRTPYAVLASVIAVAACSSGGAGAAPTTSSAPSASSASTAAAAKSSAGAPWLTYHRTNSRAGVASGVPHPRGLTKAWAVSLDGAVYGQPLVVGGRVIVATENDSVYGLSLSGRHLWRRHLGTPASQSELPCGNIFPLGITGTPAYDAKTGSVFVVTETTGAHHTLWALNAKTGAKQWHRTLDVLSNRDRRAEQERGALAVANGRVYVPFGGLLGDCGNYIGYVTAVATNGKGHVAHYAVPSGREAGIWAASGPAIDGKGDVYVAVGNGSHLNGSYDGSDSVLRLSPTLSKRLGYFAPRTWASENADDLDLGSTGPTLVSHGNLVVSGKNDHVYLLKRTHLGHIGGYLATITGCRGFGGSAFSTSANTAFVPCTEGLLAVHVGAHSLSKGWRANGSITGSPVIGGGAVWTLDTGSGELWALGVGHGHALAHHGVGSVSRFASPVLSGNLVLVPTLNGVYALRIH